MVEKMTEELKAISENSTELRKLGETLESLAHSDDHYKKNVLYISPQEQEKLKTIKLLFAGAGIGSVIAEAALRVGFESFILIDGDKVGPSNLNRQNYCRADVGSSKVSRIKSRLESINPNANIVIHDLFLDSESNIMDYLSECDIAINAIDFDDGRTAFEFDKACQKRKIPVVHPFNFGWAGAAYVVTPDSPQVFDLHQQGRPFELVLIDEFLRYIKENEGFKLDWFDDFAKAYTKFSEVLTPPQLIVGSQLASAIVIDILFSLVHNLEIKTFPTPYFLSTR